MHGKNSVIKIADVTAVLRDLSTYTRSVEGLPTDEAAVADKSTMGSTVSTYERGRSKGKFTMGGVYDSAITSGPDVVLNGITGLETPVLFEYGPEGSAAGKVKYSGAAFCTSYTTSTEYDSLVMWKAAFTVNGAVARGVFP